MRRWSGCNAREFGWASVFHRACNATHPVAHVPRRIPAHVPRRGAPRSARPGRRARRDRFVPCLAVPFGVCASEHGEPSLPASGVHCLPVPASSVSRRLRSRSARHPTSRPVRRAVWHEWAPQELPCHSELSAESPFDVQNASPFINELGMTRTNHGHGALSVMRGVSRSDARAARLPTRPGTAGSERR